MIGGTGWEIDHVDLAKTLKVLAFPTRLQLLDVLRLPQPLSDIRITATQSSGGVNPTRPLARQTVHEHLQRLMEVGLVRVDQASRGGRDVPMHRVDQQRLYAVLESLRAIASLFAGSVDEEALTQTLALPLNRARPKGPRLCLVHGMYEGQVYPLSKDTAEHGAWTIGRRGGLPVCLDYDPYVAQLQAAISRHGKRYLLTDMGGRNRTAVHWVPLPKGGSIELNPGDIINVGRSILTFAGE